LLDAVDLRGAHDFRHTFATWLEDAAIPARVIDELMGHEASSRGAQQLSSAMGTHYRHTTPEMAARVVTAIQARLAVVVRTAKEALEANRTKHHVACSDDRAWWFFWQISGKRRLPAHRAGNRPGAGPGLSCGFVVEPPGGIEPPTPSLPWNHWRFGRADRTAPYPTPPCITAGQGVGDAVVREVTRGVVRSGC
jgi:Phage integrase family